MVKTALKEIMIIALMCIAILLILAIMLYDYNPLNKVIPSRIAYSTPNEIVGEVSAERLESVTDDSSIQRNYSITDADLDKYKKSDRYVPGKEHPFSNIENSIGDVIPGMEVNEVTDETVVTNNQNPDSTNKYINTSGKK